VAALQEQRKELDKQIQQLTTVTPVEETKDTEANDTPTKDTPTKDTRTKDTPEPQPAPFAAVAALQQVPGIGLITAASMVSRLQSRHFPRSDAFVAYCGLDVKIIESGQHKGQRGLTKQGDAELRRLLYLAAKASAVLSGQSQLTCQGHDLSHAV
jgi:transposase